jgi:CSLREA domain-containing protein
MRFARVLQFLLAVVCMGGIFAAQTLVRAADTPTIYNVNTTADEIDETCDNSHCSLREAIIAANAIALTSPTPTINLIPGTYTLTLTGANEDQAQTGDLDIWRSMNLRTTGIVVIDGNQTDRIFDLHYGKLDVQDMTLQHGSADLGGAIRVGPNVDLDPQRYWEVYLSGNSLDIRENTADQGGAVFAESDVSLNQTDVFLNVSQFNGTLTTSGKGSLGLYDSSITQNTGSGIWAAENDNGPGLVNVTISGNSGYGNFSTPDLFCAC